MNRLRRFVRVCEDVQVRQAIRTRGTGAFVMAAVMAVVGLFCAAVGAWWGFLAAVIAVSFYTEIGVLRRALWRVYTQRLTEGQ